MLHFRHLAFLCLSLPCLVTHSVRAELIIETTSGWNGQTFVGNLSPGLVWGQTFTAPSSASQLTKASFWVQPYPLNNSNSGPYAFEINAYLMAWDGLKGIQPILANSLISTIAPPLEMTQVDFDFHDVGIDDDQKYVLFLIVSPSTEISYLTLGYLNSNQYSGGTFGGPYAGSISNVSSRSWSLFPSDLAFEIHFTAVPELSSILIAPIGAAVIFAMSRRKHAIR